MNDSNYVFIHIMIYIMNIILKKEFMQQIIFKIFSCIFLCNLLTSMEMVEFEMPQIKTHYNSIEILQNFPEPFRLPKSLMDYAQEKIKQGNQLLAKIISNQNIGEEYKKSQDAKKFQRNKKVISMILLRLPGLFTIKLWKKAKPLPEELL